MNDPPRQTLNSATETKAHAPGPSVLSTACLSVPATRLYEVMSGGFSIQYQATTVTPPG